MYLEYVDILTKTDGETRLKQLAAGEIAAGDHRAMQHLMWQEPDGSWTAVYTALDPYETERYVENWPTKAQALLYLLTNMRTEEIRELI